MAELARKYKVHPTKIADRKRMLVASSADAFERGSPRPAQTASEFKELPATMGKQTLGIDFLSGALDTTGLLSGKQWSTVRTNCP